MGKTTLESVTVGTAGTDAIYERIYEAILDQRLPPGAKLKEVPLAEVFGVTRGTIRKVFTQLAAHKVIELTPNRGATVAHPSIEESRDLFAARRTIECAIVESLVQSITKAQIRELTAMVKLENAAYETENLREALKLSVDFHRVLADMAGNTVIADMLEQLVKRTPLVVLAYRDPMQSSSCGNLDHVDLLKAIAAKDAKAAVEKMKCHLCNLEGQLKFKLAKPEAELAQIFARDDRKYERPLLQ